MKARISLALAGIAVFCLAGAATAQTCPDTGAPSIIAPSAAGAKCLSAMAKSATKLVQTRLKVDGKCATKLDHIQCPTQKDTDKILKIATKGEEKIAKSCDAAALAGLASSYSAGFTGQQAGSCSLSQADVEARAMVGNFNGVPSNLFDAKGGKDRDKCVDAVSKAGTKYVASVLKGVNKCVDAQVKAGTVGDLGPICVGSFAGGSYVPATDPKASATITKAITKAADGIQKKCSDVLLANANVDSMFACFGAQNGDDLKDCVVCNSWGNILSVLDASYAESGTVVTAVGGLQTAIDAALPGDKLLVDSGTYEEEVVVLIDDLSLVGCGGHVGDRPAIIEPALGGPFTNGVFSALNDNLLFQSLELNGWPENGIFVSEGDNIAFRDIVGDGEQESLYAVFPVTSTNVLVESCDVKNVTDAGVYVGQSDGIISRYNRIYDNVAGQEIENSQNADVYANTHTNNVGGLLIFTLPGPTLQFHGPHTISHNISDANNLDHDDITPNGGAVSAVPSGTGMIVISTEDSDFSFNYSHNNRSFGLALLDQLAINILAGSEFFDQSDPTKHRTTSNNYIHDNDIDDNGGDPDSTPPNDSPLGADYIHFIGDDAVNGNCFENVLSGQTFIELTPNDCP